MDASGGAVTVSTRLSHSWLLLFWGGQPGVDWCKGVCLYGPDVVLAVALGNAVRLEPSQTAPRIPCSRGDAWRCVRVVHTCHVHLGLCWSWHVLGPGLLNSSSWCSPVPWLVALPWLFSGWRVVLCEGGAHVPCSPGPLLVLARAWAVMVLARVLAGCALPSSCAVK